MKSMTILGLALAIAPMAAEAATVTQWRPVTTPRWAPGVMYDAATAVRKGDSVTAWIRYVDMAEHPPAQMKTAAAALPKGTQIDSRIEIDCKRPRFRIVRMRMTDAKGEPVGEKEFSNGTPAWEPLGTRSRGAAMKPQICALVR